MRDRGTRYGDDDRPRPRRRGTRPRKRGNSPGGLVSTILIATVVIGGVVAGIVYAKKHAHDTAAGGVETGRNTGNGDLGEDHRGGASGGSGLIPRSRPALPEGWIDYTAPDKSFRVYLPDKPQKVVSGTFRLIWLPGSSNAIEGFVENRPGQLYMCNLAVATIPLKAGLSHREQVKAVQGQFLGWLPISLGDQITEHDVTWAGKPAVEIVIGSPNASLYSAVGFSRTPYLRVARILLDGDRFYAFWLSRPGDRAMIHESEKLRGDIATFFDSFEILK